MYFIVTESVGIVFTQPVILYTGTVLQVLYTRYILNGLHLVRHQIVSLHFIFNVSDCYRNRIYVAF